jgi:hypothetical protein
VAVLVQAEENRLLDASFGTATYTAPTTPMKLALVTVLGTATAAGTEVAGGSYARQTLAMSAASAGSASNSAVITFSNMPAVTVVGVDVYDSAGSPRRCWFGPLATNRTTAAGDNISFAVASIVASLG